MNREGVTRIAVLALLLMAGLLTGWHLPSVPGDAGGDSFRQWFWEERGLDLLAQVGLIFAGALGIAALLPRGRETGE